MAGNENSCNVDRLDKGRYSPTTAECPQGLSGRQAQARANHDHWKGAIDYWIRKSQLGGRSPLPYLDRAMSDFINHSTLFLRWNQNAIN